MGTPSAHNYRAALNVLHDAVTFGSDNTVEGLASTGDGEDDLFGPSRRPPWQPAAMGGGSACQAGGKADGCSVAWIKRLAQQGKMHEARKWGNAWGFRRGVG